MAAIQPVYLND